MIDSKTLDRMTAGYCATAEWCERPEGTNTRISPAQKRLARSMVRAWCIAGYPVIREALRRVTPEQLGGDFWLDRCGHGVGFKDRPKLDEWGAPEGLAPFRDRDGKEYRPDGDSLADALSALTYGTAGAISPFAYPSLDYFAGWLTFSDVDPFEPWDECPWGFWRSFREQYAGTVPPVVSIRRDPEWHDFRNKTQMAVLFFWADDSLMSYAHIGQHSECSRAYMQACKPVIRRESDPLPDDCAQLLREWCNQPPVASSVGVRVVARLQAPRGVR